MAEEDASSLRSSSHISSAAKGSNVSLNTSPLDSILSVVAGITGSGHRKSLTKDDVLEAIDRGGKTTFASASPSSAYWVEFSVAFCEVSFDIFNFNASAGYLDLK